MGLLGRALGLLVCDGLFGGILCGLWPHVVLSCLLGALEAMISASGGSFGHDE